MGRFSDPQDPLFQALNSSIRFDYRLAPYDIEQSLAHARMLERSGVISGDDLAEIERGLTAVREEVEHDRFEVKPDDEDVHMAIERRLTELIGPTGGKLHTARSRNDQVATDVAMLVRAHALTAQTLLRELMTTLVDQAERHLDWPLPGYTHMQRAQPVYLSHHLLAYFWKLRRDRAVCSLPPTGPASSVSRRSIAMWMSSSPSLTSKRSCSSSSRTLPSPASIWPRSSSEMIPLRASMRACASDWSMS